MGVWMKYGSQSLFVKGFSHIVLLVGLTHMLNIWNGLENLSDKSASDKSVILEMTFSITRILCQSKLGNIWRKTMSGKSRHQSPGVHRESLMTWKNFNS